MATIYLNGKEQETAVPVSLIDLMRKNNVAQPEMVAVQVNGGFVDRSNFDTALIKEGDEVDFLYFMGGGSAC